MKSTGRTAMHLVRNLIAVAMSLVTATAYAATSLPGGATTLSESHDDWQVQCQVVKELVTCAAQQQQFSSQSNRRVLAVQMIPGADGLDATIVLPFGLLLAKGAVLSVDGKLTSKPQFFKTCTPSGCLIPMTVPADWEAAMRTGTSMSVTAQSVDGQDAKFAISLKGLGSSLDRIADLTK